ncbi:antirestriction protein ArdA [Martelella alba]|uniref:Antirestriction protein ArdA n=1 Tax=Martelella alba TaxID=2590451 RepID=A0A506TYL6_9HYPH|nr:antirestriction protein ArdA [Martelella alba]TPW26416.1 antirestriction protein ArdA [Martelella alba]
MTTTLYAQPYDISAEGFYFGTIEQYQERAVKAVNAYSDQVEEFEIQFIDGEDIDCALAQAFGLNQSNIGALFAAIDDWDEHQKRAFIIAVGECGYAFDPAGDDVDDFEVDFYVVDSMRELAELFVDEGLFGDIPEHLQFYIDYDAIARDLEVDYSATEIAGQHLVYRCA